MKRRIQGRRGIREESVSTSVAEEKEERSRYRKYEEFSKSDDENDEEDNNINFLPNVSSQSEISSTQNKSSDKNQIHQQNDLKNIGYNIFKIVIVIIIIGGLFTFFSSSFSHSTENLKTCSFSDVENKYPNQTSEVFKSLQIEIEDLLNLPSKGLTVFLFVHNNSTFTNQLIEQIIRKSTNCLDPTLLPLILTNDDFTSEKATKDYGHVIEKYKQIMKRGNVLFIANLNMIPGEAARALHSICDTHNPIISRVIIFLTLIVNQNKIENPTATAHKTLFELWGSHIKRNELDALITRVTDQVFLLKDQKY